MKTKTFILLSLLICNLLPAQNVKLDIKPHFLGVRADSLFVSMDISVEIEDMNPKNAVILTPILTGQDRKILLPAIQLNGKQKQKLYVRNQILRKKKNSKARHCGHYCYDSSSFMLNMRFCAVDGGAVVPSFRV